MVFSLERVWKGGVTALVFAPLAFIGRIAALIPPPRFHSRRLFGVFAANHALRSRVVPKPPDPRKTRRPVAPKRPASMAWADLLRRVWLIDALECPRPGCHGRLRIVSAVFDPTAVEAISAALIDAGTLAPPNDSRAPPPRRDNPSH